MAAVPVAWPDHDEQVERLSSLLGDIRRLAFRCMPDDNGCIDFERLHLLSLPNYKRIKVAASQGPWIITSDFMLRFLNMPIITRKLDIRGLQSATLQQLESARAAQKAHTLAALQELSPHLHQVNVLVALVGSYLCTDIQVPGF